MSKGPALVLDAGDALFKETKPARDERELEKARLILQGMGEVGTAAMAVGDRDLAAGLDWLIAEAKKAGVPLLSANLRAADGSRPFAPGILLEEGGTRVGVIGLWGEGKLPEGLQADDAAQAAEAEVERLQKEGADLIVALVHGGRRSVFAVGAVAGIDLLVPSHEGSIARPSQAAAEGTWVLGAGSRGKQLLEVAVHPEGDGPMQDANVGKRLNVELEYVRHRISDGRQRVASEADETRREALQEMVATFEKRLVDIEGRIAAAQDIEGRRFRAEPIHLDASVEGDPALAEKLEAFLEEEEE